MTLSGACRALIGCSAILGSRLAPCASALRADERPPLPCREEVANVDEPGAENIPFLHLRRGSLIESIAFSAAYLRGAPGEDCIVLISPEGTRIGGVAVYTKADRLFLRSAAYGVLPLPGLTAADINRTEKIHAAMAAAMRTVPRLAYSTEVDSDEAQLAKAALAVDFFPSAISEVALRPTGTAPSIPERKTRVLVIDWNGKHYLWSPTTGVIDVPVPLDPLTKTAFLCVQQPELPESVLFAAEFARLHPEERAETLLDPALCSHPLTWFARGAAVAAYTEGDAVRLHTPFGNIALPGATRADFSRLPILTAKAFERYHDYLNTHGSASGEQPEGLPGDTDDLQVKRAHFRLQVANARPGRINGNRSVLIIRCGNLQCVYAPGHGAAYSGWLPPYQALLVDGIVFAGSYLKSHPGERACVIAHPPPGRLTYPQGGINAHTFYTRGSALWGHITQDHAGEYRVAGSAGSDIEDRGKLARLCADNPSMAATSARTTASILGSDYRRSVASMSPYDGREFTAIAVLAQLSDAGVPCRMVRERERMEDGRIVDFPSNAVAFQWGGAWFVYARQKVFRARARGYPSDMTLD